MTHLSLSTLATRMTGCWCCDRCRDRVTSQKCPHNDDCCTTTASQAKFFIFFVSSCRSVVINLYCRVRPSSSSTFENRICLSYSLSLFSYLLYLVFPSFLFCILLDSLTGPLPTILSLTHHWIDRDCLLIYRHIRRIIPQPERAYIFLLLCMWERGRKLYCSSIYA